MKVAIHAGHKDLDDHIAVTIFLCVDIYLLQEQGTKHTKSDRHD
jgi:hypothetical protein